MDEAKYISGFNSFTFMDSFSHSCQLVEVKWRVTLKLQELGSCHWPEESILKQLQLSVPENATLKQPLHAGKLTLLIYYLFISIMYNWQQQFFHRSFIYIEKDQKCWTLGKNSKSETVLRRSSTVLYEKQGTFEIPFVP